MKRSVGLAELLGFALTSLGGTLLHFLYGWLGEAAWIAPFSAVNESTFEHMKLLFWPMLLYAAVESLYFRDRKDFWCVTLRGTLLGLALIPILFYTYNGAVGRSPDWLNIAIFFVAAAAAYLYTSGALKDAPRPCSTPLAIGFLLLIALLFVVFTWNPPRIPLFRDPITGSYGI